MHRHWQLVGLASLLQFSSAFLLDSATVHQNPSSRIQKSTTPFLPVPPTLPPRKVTQELLQPPTISHQAVTTNKPDIRQLASSTKTPTDFPTPKLSVSASKTIPNVIYPKALLKVTLSPTTPSPLNKSSAPPVTKSGVSPSRLSGGSVPVVVQPSGNAHGGHGQGTHVDNPHNSHTGVVQAHNMQLAQPQLGVAATGHDMPERSDHPAVKGGAQDFLPPVNVGQAFGNSWKSQVTSGISVTPGVQHPATGLVCFDDSISVVNQDVPCPSHTKKRSVELSHHHLESLLKGFGGGVLTEYMSVHPPAHITDLSVQDIEQLPKTPESRAEMADRLKGRLVLLQTRYSKLRDLIQSYVTSSAGLALRRTFLRFLNSVSNSSAGDSFCSQNNSETSEDVKVSKINSKVSIVCQSLMSEAKRLSGLLARLEEVVETQTDFHHKLNSTYSNKTLCDQIKDLQQSIRLTASQIKELVKLHNSFQSSVVTLQNILPEAVILLEELVNNLRASTDSFERDTLKDSEISASKRKLVMTSSPAPHLNISPPFSHDETSQNQMTNTKTSSKDRSRSKPSHSSTTSSASTGKVSRRVTVQNSLKELSSIIIQIILNTDHKAVNAHQASLSHHIPESVSGDSSSAAEPNLQNAIEPTMPNVGKKDTLKLSKVHRSYDVIRRLLILMRRELEKMSGVLSAADISEDATSDLGIDSYSALKHFERRVKKDVAGFALRSDACITQGQDIPGTNYVSLCSECEHTTILDSTYFPRFLTERICHPGTSSIPANQGGCLSENNSHGGECEQQHFHIPILRREPNKCMKVKSKGTEFITDKWHQSTYDLNIGCQCVLRKNSQFAKYARLP